MDEANAREKGKKAGGKTPYMPNKREAKELYVKFMNEMELVKPMLGRKIPHNVERLTGITNKMVSNAGTIEKIFPKFARFIGDNVLVGYNNASLITEC